MRRADMDPDGGIPFVMPPRLEDGLHVAPVLSWDGVAQLWVIQDGRLLFAPLRIEGRSPLSDDRTKYTPELLAVHHRTWRRGVYRLPFLELSGVQQYAAVDAAGRCIGVRVISTRAAPSVERCEVQALRTLLQREDPITRKRPPGENRF